MMINSVSKITSLTFLLSLSFGCWGASHAIAKPILASKPTANPSEVCSRLKPLTGVVKPIDSLRTDENLDHPSSVTNFCANQLTEIPDPLATPSPSLAEAIAPSQEPDWSNASNEPEPPLPAIAQTNDPQPPGDTDSPNPSIEELSPQDDSTDWRFSIMPYATIPINTYGTNVILGRSVNYHASLGTLLQKLQIAVSARAEAWNGNWGFIADGYYASLEGTGFKQFDRPIINATLVSSLTFQQGIYDFALSYHFGAIPVAYDPKKPSNREFPLIWFQPIVGTRLNQIDSTITTTLTFDRIDRALEASVSKGRTWFEPLIGGKLGVQVSDPLTLWFRGDASGFGLAGETDLSWNIFFGADWWVNRSLSLSLSYRFYEIRYGNGTGDDAFRFNENFNGPTLAATFNF